MRNISFNLTQDQIRSRIKRVTRRDGWLHAKVGDILNGCEKCQGLKNGEKIVSLCTIRITDVRRERIDAITPEDVVLEGFPDWTPEQFVAFYCQHNKKQPSDLTTRIAFDYVEVKE